MEALYELYQQLFRMISVYSETEFEKILLECNAAEILRAVDAAEATADERQACGGGVAEWGAIERSECGSGPVD